MKSDWNRITFLWNEIEKFFMKWDEIKFLWNESFQFYSDSMSESEWDEILMKWEFSFLFHDQFIKLQYVSSQECWLWDCRKEFSTSQHWKVYAIINCSDCHESNFWWQHAFNDSREHSVFVEATSCCQFFIEQTDIDFMLTFQWSWWQLLKEN